MKTCIDCQQTLPFTAFVPKVSCCDGYEIRCRVCRSIKYNKSTPELLCKKIYMSQLTHSVNRGHPLPAYSKAELFDWLINQPTFENMYADWIASKYSKDLAPSVDRIDDAIPYIMGNIQLLTWQDNRAKGAQAKFDSTLITTHRGVVAFNKDGTVFKEFNSLAEAMREFGGTGTQSWGISTVCNGTPVKDGRGYLYTPKSYKGYAWQWRN